MYHNFADFFFLNCQKELVTSFTKNAKFLVLDYSHFVRGSLTLLHKPYMLLFIFAPKIDNVADVIMHFILGYCLTICHGL